MHLRLHARPNIEGAAVEERATRHSSILVLLTVRRYDDCRFFSILFFACATPPTSACARGRLYARTSGIPHHALVVARNSVSPPTLSPLGVDILVSPNAILPTIDRYMMGVNNSPSAKGSTGQQLHPLVQTALDVYNEKHPF